MWFVNNNYDANSCGGGFAVETSYVGGGHVGRVLGGRATDDVSKYFTYIILLLRSELCSV